ncbi:MAG: metal ABC transporter substrate-binding protein [Chthoniobacteraceae bacterium]
MKPFALLLLCALLACARAGEGKLRVSSFSTILTEIAREVGGNRVDVTGHVKPGVDPHEFEPKPADLKIVSSADLILVSARHMEDYIGKLREAAGGKAALLEVGDQLPGPKDDPHWWHSIANIERATRIVRDELIRLRPNDRAEFEANAAACTGRLEALEKWVKAKVAELPRDRRKLVTNHDSFGYFAREFGFTVHPIAGLTQNDQPGSKKVAEIIAAIRREGVKAIFSEDNENPKVIQQITRETGAKLGGKLYSDGLGAKPDDSVEAMFRHNVTIIVEALK